MQSIVVGVMNIVDEVGGRRGGTVRSEGKPRFPPPADVAELRREE
jgi:hypothetical protein